MKNRSMPWVMAGFGFLLFFTHHLWLYFVAPPWLVDLGPYHQAVWQLSQGRAPISSFVPSGNRFLDAHFQPILILPALLYRFFPSLITLLFFESLLLALGGVPIFLWAEEKLKEKSCIFFPLCFYFFAGTQAAAHMPVHGMTMGGALLPWVFYYTAKNHRLGMVISSLLLLSAQENFGFYLAAVGLGFFSRKLWNRSVAQISAGMVYTLLLILMIMPNFGDHSGYYEFQSYQGIGLSEKDFFPELIQKPFDVMTKFFDTPGKRVTLLLAFGSFAFLPVLSSRALLFAFLNFSERFLSDHPPKFQIGFHYGVPLGAAFSFFAIDTISWLAQWKKQLPILSPRKMPLFLFLFVLLFPMSFSLLYGGPFKPAIGPLLGKFFPSAVHQIPYEELKSLHRMLSKVPAKAKVTASECLVPYLANREFIYKLSQKKEINTDFVVLSFLCAYQKHQRGQEVKPHGELLRELVGSGSYRAVDATKTAILLKATRKSE